MATKKRFDMLVLEHFPHLTRNQVQSFIMQGKVKVDGVVFTKSGQLISIELPVTLDQLIPKFVCRAGQKLERALEHFGVDPKDKVILDAGLSTGGFTDCLLQQGAKHVYGVDVGYGQVHEKIRTDPRVTIMERTNLRYVTTLPELVDIVTLDLSFISILKVMDAVCAVLKPDGCLVTLIKPQFEARQEQVGKGGIIRDPAVHQEVLDRVVAGIVERGFMHKGTTESPITGSTGNKEFLGYFVRA